MEKSVTEDLKIQISDQNQKMREMLGNRNKLEIELEHVKNSRNATGQEKMRELEQRILILSKDIENTREVIQEKNNLVEEKNQRIRQLAEQNKNSSTSYDMFQERFRRMEGTK